MKRFTVLGLIVGASLFGAACGGGNTPPATSGPTVKGSAPTLGAGNNPVNDAAAASFGAALQTFLGHEKANDWSDASCASVAKDFEASVDRQPSKKFPEAHYNAALAFQRCDKDTEAKNLFAKALSEDPKFHHAKAALALYQLKADSNVDAAILALEGIVTEASFQNVPALVNLAMLQMDRDSDRIGDTCKTFKDGKPIELKDFECAKLNLQRSLAIDDSYMPAFNQLALFYFRGAKKRGAAADAKAAAAAPKAGAARARVATQTKRKLVDVQALELAALVCAQAVRKGPTYAPIYNTAGLIQSELGQINGAVSSFQKAAVLDQRFFEAQMNLAAVNLGYRGFYRAQEAYSKAIAVKPNDYEAHLGLALALRGQITDVNFEKEVPAVQSELDQCKKIDANRPDAYFNEGILTQEYKANAGGSKDAQIAQLKAAQAVFATFVEKAGDKPGYADGVKKAKERLEDITTTINFLNEPALPGATPPPAAAPGATTPTAPTDPTGGAATPTAPKTPPTTPAPGQPVPNPH